MVKSAELGGGGELAEPEEVGGLFEGGALGELVDVDAAIGEDAGVAVDPADGGAWWRRCLPGLSVRQRWT